MINSPVRYCVLNPLASLVLTVFVGMIVVMLVLPQVDLPDVTAQHNSVLAASCRASDHALHEDVRMTSEVRLENSSEPDRLNVDEGRRVSEDLPIKYRSFRC